MMEAGASYNGSKEKMEKYFSNMTANDVKEQLIQGAKDRLANAKVKGISDASIYSDTTEDVPLYLDLGDDIEQFEDNLEKVYPEVSSKEEEFNMEMFTEVTTEPEVQQKSLAQISYFNIKNPNYFDLFPQVLKRIVQFSLNHTPDANVYELMRVYQNEWGQENPNLITIIVIQEDQVVGHMCAQLSQWYGSYSIIITQFEFNANFTRSMIRKGLLLFENWRKKLGIETVEALAFTPAIANLYKRLFQAQPQASLYKLNFEEWVGELE